MADPTKILLQTTIPFTEDDWNIGRFSMLKDHLASLRGPGGERLYDVTARDRDNSWADDPVLSRLDESDFDEIWLFAVDTGGGLTANDCAGITRFRKRGGGIFSTRDHNDLGSSLCTIGGVGKAHYFHTKNPDPDETRHTRDDTATSSIDYPNYHSGANGDYQRIEPAGEVHELLRRADGTAIEHFPAHPHEGAVGAPDGTAAARVIATGTSRASGRPFNLAVAFERDADARGNRLGRAIAESSFHHLADYNWDTDAGCPSFLEEPPGDGIKREPGKMSDIKAYAANLARWLAPEEADRR
jgi:hypothetical protein